MPRRQSDDVRLRPLRKRSISDSNLNRFAPNFVNNISTNIQDVLDLKSKGEYHAIKEQDEEQVVNEEPSINQNEANDILNEGKSTTDNPSPIRKRKPGFVAIGSQVRNSLSKFVGSRMSLKRQNYQPNDPRQLIAAIRNQDINRVRYILDTCPVDVNGTDSKGVSAVHEAALDGQWDIITLLLQHNADVNKSDNEGLTSLDYAVFGGHFECAQYLIHNGATTKNVQNGMPTFFKEKE